MQASKRPGQLRPAGIETRRGGARNTEGKKEESEKEVGVEG